MNLAKAVQGAKRPSQLITWKREDGTPEVLTGATITGKLRLQGQTETQLIMGTFTVTDGANGVFRWDYADADVATAGSHDVQFSAVFGGAEPTPAKTFVTRWTVQASLDPQDVNTVTLTPNVYNVMDYGAKGDGSTDDTTAIQGCINTAPNGATIAFPSAKTFKITSTLSLTSRQKLILNGGGKILFGDHVAFTLTSCDQVEFKDLILDGNQASGATPTTSTAFQFNGSVWCVVDDCKIENCKYGVYTVYGSGQNHEIYVRNCRLTTAGIAGSRGIYYDSVDNWANGNVIRGFETAIYVNRSSVRITNNHLYKYPSSTYSYGLYAAAATLLTVTGNFFDNAYTYGIYAFEPWGLTIADNMFQHTQLVPFIYFDAATNPTTISNVVIKGNTFFQYSGGTNTNPIAWSSNVSIDGSRRIYVIENNFMQVTPKATQVIRSGTLVTGNTTVTVSFANDLIGSIRHVVTGDFEKTMRISSFTATDVTMRVDSALAGNSSVYLQVSTYCHQVD